MARYYYGLSVNDEYTAHFAVESDKKPICINDEDTNCLIVNGAKIFFEEDIWEVDEMSAKLYGLNEYLGLEDLDENNIKAEF